MIARLHGTLDSIDDGCAMVTLPSGVTYQVLLPAFAGARLAATTGQPITLHTLEFYESHAQGATMLPRLAGFLTAEDKAFYELFVTCKGIGYRRALRAMTLASAQIAAAIADRDLATLQSLPEIGRRTAETITVTLRDKVDRFAAATTASTADQPNGAPGPAASTNAGLARETLEALLQLGENRTQAITWIDQILTSDNPPQTPQALLAEVYRLKATNP